MFKNQNAIHKFLTRVTHDVRLCVIGDLMLDTYIFGAVDRISPEAPIPVVCVENSRQMPGGAANVAFSIASLGFSVSVAGIIGCDQAGTELLELLESELIDSSAIYKVQARPTTHKTRILSGHQQIVRLDKESRSTLSGEKSLTFIQSALSKLDASVCVVLSDYGKGVLSDECCRSIINKCNELSIPVLVDPKGRSYKKYSGATGLCPNRSELALVAGCDGEDLNRLLTVGEQLCSDLGVGFMAVTLGELGIALLERGSVAMFPTVAREVFDVAGAGDTVIATLAAAIASDIDRRDAIQLANLAAGIVVGNIGTCPVSRQEILARISLERTQENRHKVLSREEAIVRTATWRAQGRKVVFTNGCYDLLHLGHVTLIEKAKCNGDRLIVGLNSDRSVRALKGESRPIVGQQEREQVLAALSCVDAVVIFDEDTPLALIKELRPDILVKGSDYSEEQVVGAKEVRSWGGRVVLVPVVNGCSTTGLVKRAVTSIH